LEVAISDDIGLRYSIFKLGDVKVDIYFCFALSVVFVWFFFSCSKEDGDLLSRKYIGTHMLVINPQK
jgi:hypothetical protein